MKYEKKGQKITIYVSKIQSTNVKYMAQPMNNFFSANIEGVCTLAVAQMQHYAWLRRYQRTCKITKYLSNL